MNPNVEVSSEAFFSQNTYNKGISKGTRDTNLASDTEAKNTHLKHPPGFSATDAAREKPSKKRSLEADTESEVSEKGTDKYADFKRFRSAPKYDKFNWNLPEHLAKDKKDHFNKIIPGKNLKENISVKNPVPPNLHRPRMMNEFMRDLIFDKRAGTLEVTAN